MSCDDCERIVSIGAKCSDLCSVQTDDINYTGYVPYDIGIGGGDYIAFAYCLDCGRIQDKFPIKQDVVDGALSSDEEM